ncbi:6-O-methylguanine DNA methyltransferase [Methyloceanibacter stevinii]|uniref:methylated-DNA--[protein]-cysteine S-methyltransferase n=1 Tax=Methyloceanibacter stevinii TaxID=1774970 RepID=A0A1E3VVK8_9HYPH|nr:bifunctional DNA-binding transcriptional regulator/O6-methylguanine-DNA methyltransferase Ada [Methyloceanibacter stevinii]ODR97539.1 6-O-methylguanine DNA methyltransferase [Methyloceanibacter stevinii]
MSPNPATNFRHLDDDSAWQAVQTRNSRLDGAVYYAVKTTGIYCLPSCPARKPNRANVSFFVSCSAAERAGYRPCMRCKPAEAAAAPAWALRVEKACRLMEESEVPIPLADLARAVGSSTHHFHRQFRSALGITPKATAAALRNDRVRDALSRGATVTEALYEAGFSSSGRFYSGASAALGMAPDSFRKGGASEQLTFATMPCSLGHVLVAASTKGVCAILLGDSADGLAGELRALFPQAILNEADASFAATAASIVALVDRPESQSAIPLDIRGTAFQRRVWETLRKIPAGETRSYSELAAAIGSPGAVRAVAGACAANKLAVAIPCHRILRRDGSLSGYRWGQERKRALLDKEKS